MPLKPLARFRARVLAVIATLRLRECVRVWQQVKCAKKAVPPRLDTLGEDVNRRMLLETQTEIKKVKTTVQHLSKFADKLNKNLKKKE